MSQDDCNAVFAGMEAVWREESRRMAASAPRCHLTPMEHNIGEEECWWECRHCGHTKKSGEAA